MPDMQIHGKIPGMDINMMSQGEVVQSKAMEGLYRGLQVKAPVDAMSLLANAAEELTFAHAETVEKKAKARKDEEVNKADRTNSAEFMAQKLKDMNPEQLKKFKDGVAEAGKDPKKILDLAVKSFSGRGGQHLALTYAMEEFEKTDPDLAAAIRTARAQLEEAHGPEIRAEYNINDVDDTDVGGPENARGLYRGTVLGHSDVGEAFLFILDKHGMDGFDGALDFLRKAIGTDLSAQSPSVEKSELEQANKDLAHVQVMRNILTDCTTTLDTLAKRHGVTYP